MYINPHWKIGGGEIKSQTIDHINMLVSPSRLIQLGERGQRGLIDLKGTLIISIVTGQSQTTDRLLSKAHSEY